MHTATLNKAKVTASKIGALLIDNKEYLLLTLGLLLAPATAWWVIISPISSIISFAQILLCIAQLVFSTFPGIVEIFNIKGFSLSAKTEDYQDNFYYFVIMQFACLLPLLAINRIATILNLVITLNHMPNLVSGSLKKNEVEETVLDKQQFAQKALSINLLSKVRALTSQFDF